MNRTQIFLLIAVLCLGSFYVWSKKTKFETEEREYQEARYFPHLEDEQVGTITVWSKDPSFEYTVKHRGDRLFLEDHLVSIEDAGQLVFSLAQLKRDREIATQPTEEQLEEYGLKEPSFKITIEDKSGKNLGTVELGNRTPTINEFYGRMADGGPVSTVEAYMLVLLDEKPEDLRESSIFPVEVAAVDHLLWETESGRKVQLNKIRDDDESNKGRFLVEGEPDKELDETLVDDLMNELKGLQAARFLGDDEETEVGPVMVRYEAREGFSEYAVVTELGSPVRVNPKLRYGRRYFTKKGQTQPAEGTLERFVVELPSDSPLLQPELNRYLDRRVLRLSVDDVSEVTAEYQGKTLQARRLTPGLWGFDEPDLDSNASNSQLMNDMLWALRDLRYEKAAEGGSSAGQADWKLTVKDPEGSHTVRFGSAADAPSYVETGEQRYTLKDESTAALTEALQKLLKT